jgi:uncharacterized protein
MKQLPQEIWKGITTRSPGASSLTSEPTSSTTPIGSCLVELGNQPLKGLLRGLHRRHLRIFKGPSESGGDMGQPVVHFEVVGRDAAKLQSYYSELFGWQIDASNPMNYGIVQREGNTNSEGVGIGGGVGPGPEGYDGHVTFYVEVPDVEAALAKAEELGGSRMMGPDEVMEGLVIGMFNDPEGHTIGVIRSGS